VGSFTPCESVSASGASVVAIVAEDEASQQSTFSEVAATAKDHHACQSHARPRRRTTLSAALRPRVSARLARDHRAREALTAPRPSVVSGRCVMAGFC